jgi:hypothetical protein
LVSYPEWGRWTITPEDGSFLKPHHGPQEISVTVVVPREKQANFSGALSFQNCDDEADVENIDVTVTTMKQLSTLSFIQMIKEWVETFLAI